MDTLQGISLFYAIVVYLRLYLIALAMCWNWFWDVEASQLLFFVLKWIITFTSLVVSKCMKDSVKWNLYFIFFLIFILASLFFFFKKQTILSKVIPLWLFDPRAILKVSIIFEAEGAFHTLAVFFILHCVHIMLLFIIMS